MKLLEAIEMLECAKINCDNSKRVPALIDMVKMQIDEAIKLLDGKEET